MLKLHNVSSPPRLAYYYFTGLYALSESVKRVRSERFNTEVIQLTNWGFHIPLFIAQHQNSSKEANTDVRNKWTRTVELLRSEFKSDYIRQITDSTLSLRASKPWKQDKSSKYWLASSMKLTTCNRVGAGLDLTLKSTNHSNHPLTPMKTLILTGLRFCWNYTFYWTCPCPVWRIHWFSPLTCPEPCGCFWSCWNSFFTCWFSSNCSVFWSFYTESDSCGSSSRVDLTRTASRLWLLLITRLSAPRFLSHSLLLSSDFDYFVLVRIERRVGILYSYTILM